MNKLTALAYDEVINLHVKIEELFHGVGGLASADELVQHFHPNFSMITPDGGLHDYNWICDLVKGAHGSRPSVKISIKNFKEIFCSAEMIIVLYEEFQQITAAQSLHRISTAILLPSHRLDQPLLWYHLQETWMNISA